MARHGERQPDDGNLHQVIEEVAAIVKGITIGDLENNRAFSAKHQRCGTIRHVTFILNPRAIASQLFFQHWTIAQPRRRRSLERAIRQSQMCLSHVQHFGRCERSLRRFPLLAWSYG